MWINSVELRNIKSYSDEEISFRCGVNGISGANGAGKTTILESIGFALFDNLPYSKKHFLRKGEKAGEVRIQVVASDGVEYTIARSVKGDYRVESPVGDLAVGKIDVQDWIAENLFDGAINSGDLSSIFENAVGVPQGTFTTSFLSTPTVRKKVFDSILRVDEYRTAFENLSDVSRIIKNEIDDLEKKHHELKGSTANYDELNERFGRERSRISKIKEEIAELSKHLEKLGLKKEDLGRKKELIDSTNKEMEKLERDVSELKKHLVTAKKQLEEALDAKKILDETWDLRNEYLESQKKLEALSGEKEKRDRLNERRLEQESKIRQMEQELEKKKNLSEELGKHRKVLKEIEPLVKEQKELEMEINSIENQMRDVVSLKSDISSLEGKNMTLEEISKDLMRLEKERKEIEPMVKEQAEIEREIKSIEEQTREINSLRSDISGLKEKKEMFETLSKDLRQLEKAQKEIEPLVERAEELKRQKQEMTVKKSDMQEKIKSIRKNKRETGETNRCPILDGVTCAAVRSFSEYFEEKLNKNEGELSTLKNGLVRIEKELKGLNNPEEWMNKNSSEISRITGQLTLLSDVKEQLQRCNAKLHEYDSNFSQKYSSYLTDVPEDADLPAKIKKTRERMEKRREGLNNPEQLASNTGTLINALTKELDRIKTDDGDIKREHSRLFDIKLGLSEFSDLDLRETEIRKIIHDSEPHYLKYLQNEKNAGKVDMYRSRCDGMNREISGKKMENDRLIKALAEQRSTFDEAEFERVKKEYEGGTIELESKKTEHDVVSGNLNGLEKDLEKTESLIREKEILQMECESKREFLSYIEFIRSTLKDSAQLIAGKLIKSIGTEANRIYCEIINDYTQELRWTHDYAIIITEHGEEKDFNQLSGGEQMGASLAVRFALLKILSGCDVVFLDEPTQNMDETRREKLSEQILNISGFKQIFVISHDDTFNERYENVIRVEKIDGESRVIGGDLIS